MTGPDALDALDTVDAADTTWYFQCDPRPLVVIYPACYMQGVSSLGTWFLLHFCTILDHAIFHAIVFGGFFCFFFVRL